MGKIRTARLLASLCVVGTLGVVGVMPGTAGATPSTPSLAACKSLRNIGTWRDQASLQRAMTECLAAINAQLADIPTTDNGGRSWR